MKKQKRKIKEKKVNAKIRTTFSKIISYKENFELARGMKRKVLLFLGPTNSGKTYEALQYFKNASSGTYLAPLRLLAQEGQENIKKLGFSCSLVTGEEVIKEEGDLVSSTIEMANFDKRIDLAVIDEVQMLFAEDRGWAWTQAIVGIPASTIILCGSPDSEEIVRKLVAHCGDEIEVRHFERKTTLTIMPTVVNFKKIERGDALIAFSRRNVLALRDMMINKGFKPSVIYGALSPDVRRNEAKRFNEGETDVVVATDAIGMGLNLPVKRIVFSTVRKFDGIEERNLTPSEIKQIAGRAGRYGKEPEGFVSAIDGHSLKLIKGAFEEPLKSPSNKVFFAPDKVTMFNLREHVKTWRKAILLWIEMIKNDAPELFKPIRNAESLLLAASIIDDFDLDMEVAWRLLMAPLNDKQLSNLSLFRDIVSYMVNNELYECDRIKFDVSNLDKSEETCSLLTLYSWLSLRFPLTCTEYEIARGKLREVNDKIEEYLRNLKKKIHVCSVCGDSLAVDFRHKMCDRCFQQSRRFHYGDYMDMEFSEDDI